MRKTLCLVPFHDIGSDLGLSELANRSAKDLLFLGRSEVHGGETVSYRGDGSASGTGEGCVR